jgi:hypothetical protein
MPDRSWLAVVVERGGSQLRVRSSVPIPNLDSLRDGVAVHVLGRMTDDRVIDADQVKPLICGSGKLLDDPKCPPR